MMIFVMAMCHLIAIWIYHGCEFAIKNYYQCLLFDGAVVAARFAEAYQRAHDDLASEFKDDITSPPPPDHQNFDIQQAIQQSLLSFPDVTVAAQNSLPPEILNAGRSDDDDHKTVDEDVRALSASLDALSHDLAAQADEASAASEELVNFIGVNVMFIGSFAKPIRTTLDMKICYDGSMPTLAEFQDAMRAHIYEKVSKYIHQDHIKITYGNNKRFNLLTDGTFDAKCTPQTFKKWVSRKIFVVSLHGSFIAHIFGSFCLIFLLLFNLFYIVQFKIFNFLLYDSGPNCLRNNIRGHYSCKSSAAATQTVVDAFANGMDIDDMDDNNNNVRGRKCSSKRTSKQRAAENKVSDNGFVNNLTNINQDINVDAMNQHSSKKQQVAAFKKILSRTVGHNGKLISSMVKSGILSSTPHATALLAKMNKDEKAKKARKVGGRRRRHKKKGRSDDDDDSDEYERRYHRRNSNQNPPKHRTFQS